MKKAITKKATKNASTIKTASFEIRGLPDDGEVIREITQCEAPWTKESIIAGLNDGDLHAYFCLDRRLHIYLGPDDSTEHEVAVGHWSFAFYSLAECY